MILKDDKQIFFAGELQNARNRVPYQEKYKCRKRRRIFLKVYTREYVTVVTSQNKSIADLEASRLH